MNDIYLRAIHHGTTGLTLLAHRPDSRLEIVLVEQDYLVIEGNLSAIAAGHLVAFSGELFILGQCHPFSFTAVIQEVLLSAPDCRRLTLKLHQFDEQLWHAYWSNLVAEQIRVSKLLTQFQGSEE